MALSFAATVDDFSRFPNGRSASRYFGLTPGRRDSSERVGRNGRTTKAGDTTVRHAAVEGLASLLNHTGAKKRERKGRKVSAAVEAEAAKCNDRNRRRYRDLVDAGKKANVAKTALASELVRQMWAMGLVVAREQAVGRQPAPHRPSEGPDPGPGAQGGLALPFFTPSLRAAHAPV